MKNRFAITFQFVRPLVLVSLLYVLCGQSSAQDFKTLHQGVEHARVDHTIGNDPVKINLLRLDLTKVRLDVHHAFDKAIGVEPTSAIAQRHGAVAAINAGFFRLDKSEFAGDAAGTLMIDGDLLSESLNKRIAVAIENLTKRTLVTFSHVETSLYVEIGDYAYAVAGINRERRVDEMVLYTERFHSSTLTAPGGIEIYVRKGKIKKIVEGSGNQPIGRGDSVFSASGTMADSLRKVIRESIFFRPVHVIAGEFPTSNRDLDIVAGIPQLIKNGKIEITWEQEKASKSFAEMRHPRTAVAKLKDGKFLMVTVDGRQSGVSVGMNLQELAEYLLSLGAIDAMNLDGGGSTTMFVDGKVVNTPSDKEGERKVSDAIVVTLRKNARR